MANVRLSNPSSALFHACPRTTQTGLALRRPAHSRSLRFTLPFKSVGNTRQPARVLRHTVKPTANISATPQQISDADLNSEREGGKILAKQAGSSRVKLAGVASLVAVSCMMASAPAAMANEAVPLLALATTQVFTTLKLLDYFGTVVFAIAGTLTAVENKMDIVGCIILAVITGLGGGTLRDAFFGRLPVFWFTSTEYLWICIVASVATFVIRKHNAAAFARMFNNPGGTFFEKFILWGDMVGLAAFAAVGSHIAHNLGMSPLIVAVSALMSGTFGGLTRDVICFKPPMILTREVYATAAFAGGLTFSATVAWCGCQTTAVITCFIVTGMLRTMGIIFGLRAPVAH